MPERGLPYTRYASLLRSYSSTGNVSVLDVISTVCYAPYCGGPVGIDQGQVKSVSLAPSMLNKGHTVTEPDGSLWVRFLTLSRFPR